MRVTVIRGSFKEELGASVRAGAQGRVGSQKTARAGKARSSDQKLSGSRAVTAQGLHQECVCVAGGRGRIVDDEARETREARE